MTGHWNCLTLTQQKALEAIAAGRPCCDRKLRRRGGPTVATIRVLRRLGLIEMFAGDGLGGTAKGRLVLKQGGRL